MKVATQNRCQHVYLHVNRRYFVRDQGRGQGLVPLWKCSLKKKDLSGVCVALTKAGLEVSCHPEECPLASSRIPWDKCPLYTPK